MKKYLVVICVLAISLSFTLTGTYKAKAFSSQVAAEVGNQDPDSPDFAPGEKADDSAVDSTCDTQDPYSPCFAPGEKADDSAPVNYYTPTSTPKPAATATPITPVPQTSYPSKEDILKMTHDEDSNGVGLLGIFMFSPIVSMILSFFGFLIFIGLIILVVVLLKRRSNKKENK